MPAPSFWLNPPNRLGLLSRLLAPLGALYAYGTAQRVKKQGYRASVPVICIGNINVGGTGKTPTAIALAMHLSAMGKSVHIVSRGYGGSLKGPVRVDETVHSADEVGDEPLLLSSFVQTWVARERAEGVRQAEQNGADVILLDDGFQNPSVEKDLSIVVVDATVGWGNERVLPSGPLREPVERGLKRADLVLSIGDRGDKPALDTHGVPHLTARLLPLMTGMPWEGMKVLAFAGIGNPEKFFQTLRNMGCDVIHGEGLEDHQKLTPRLMTRLETEAKIRGAQLVTTEKDAVRLPANFRAKVLTVPVRLLIEDMETLDGHLAKLALSPQ